MPSSDIHSFIFSVDFDQNLNFFMNDRLGILRKSGYIDYKDDNANNRAKFIERFQKASKAIPSGAQAKSILSVSSNKSQTIQSGGAWNFSSVEADTVLVTNRLNTHLKLIINDRFPGFMYEYRRKPKLVVILYLGC